MFLGILIGIMAEKAPAQKTPELKLPSLVPVFEKTQKFLMEKAGMGDAIKKVKEVSNEISTQIKAGFGLFEKMFKPAFMVTMLSLLAATSFGSLAFMASPYFIAPFAGTAALHGGGAFEKPAAVPAKK